MRLLHYLLIIILLHTITVTSIWPPSYKIDLKDDETFVISEELSSDDTDSLTEEEDEMMHQDNIKSLGVLKKSSKYDLLHKLVSKQNKNLAIKRRENISPPIISEENYYEDSLPWFSSFKNSKRDTEKEITVYVNDRKNQMLPKSLNKREESLKLTENETDSKEPTYDYNNFKNDYEAEITLEQKSNTTFNYTEIKEDESVKDAVKTIVEFKTPKNCSKEERRGIGIGAINCFIKDFRGPEAPNVRKLLFNRITIIAAVSFFVYLLIAIPCWCQRGWCCCCFRCKICQPQRQIDEARKFLMDNPLGVYHTKDNKKIVYEPTYYEEYAYRQLKKALMKL